MLGKALVLDSVEAGEAEASGGLVNGDPDGVGASWSEARQIWTV